MLNEKDLNLNEVHSRSYTQIATHQYNFDKVSQQKTIINNISKKDFIDCYNNIFFADDALRIDFELVCQKHIVQNENDKKDHELFSTKIRKEWTGIETFRKGIEYHPDSIINNYQKLRKA
jgi:secreted Zn-dependent insulinase-like peptidase